MLRGGGGEGAEAFLKLNMDIHVISIHHGLFWACKTEELLELQWKDFWVRLVERSEDMLESTDICPNVLLDRTLVRMGREYTHTNIVSSKADSALWAELWSEISILLLDEQTKTGIAECIKYE